MRTFRRLIAIAFVTGVVPFTTGCYYWLGYGIDAATPKKVSPTSERVASMSGKKVKVILMTGERVSGKLRRVEPFPEEVYAATYGAGRQDLAARALWVPPLGATVDLVRENGDSLRAEFLGADLDGVVIRPAGEPQPRFESARGLRLVRADSALVVSGAVLDSLLSVGALPVRSSLVLGLRGNAERRLPLNAVARMERRGMTWRVVGLSLDAVVFVATVAAIASWDWGMSGGSWSWGYW